MISRTKLSKSFFKIAFIVITFFFLPSSYAENYNETFKNSVPAKLICRNSNEVLSNDERIEIAKTLIENARTLNSLIPAISAISKKYLQEQRKSIMDTNKIFDKNGNINEKIAKEQARDIISFSKNPDTPLLLLHEETDLLINSLDSAIKSNNISDEMYYWMNAAILYIDINTWQPNIEILVNNEQLDKSYNDSLSPFYKLQHGIGMQILLCIIQPYLNHARH